MNASRVKTLIIGVLAVLLVGCSAVRLGYDNGGLLAAWWLDDQLDLDSTQKTSARVEIDRWFDWHRATQLKDYAQALATLGARADGPVDAAQVCAWTAEWQMRLDRAIDQALPAAARLLPAVRPAQWDHLARVLDEKQARLRTEYAPADRAERIDGARQRAIKRAEDLYGELLPAQRRVIDDAVAESPFDAERWLAERKARQADLLRSLKALQAPALSTAQRLAGLRALVARSQQPPDADYRAYRARFTEYNCRLAARLHNSMSPDQRRHLRQRLASWEEDLRALAAPPTRVLDDA